MEHAAELDLDLLGASRQGDDKKVLELISSGGNVMVTDRHGQTPLHFRMWCRAPRRRESVNRKRRRCRSKDKHMALDATVISH